MSLIKRLENIYIDLQNEQSILTETITLNEFMRLFGYSITFNELQEVISEGVYCKNCQDGRLGHFAEHFEVGSLLPTEQKICEAIMDTMAHTCHQ